MAGRADAAIVACSASVAERVTSGGAALPCQVSTTYDQDFQNRNPITVNREGGFFGFEDWELIDKVGSGQSGSYDVTQLDDFDTFGNWMMIFKSGDDTFLTGYLLEATQLTGDWSSPFRQVNRNGRVSYKDVSHISFYGRGEPLIVAPPSPPPGPEPVVDVPAPASLGLFAAGLLGLGLVRRRSRA
ncbi:hypothetical protein DFH01_05000 [Falsiroseomonas bella]|uniref:Ice-binding protein C-terminal domain-containing protein n=2 Tax=Falsiroseomonas bella TaxID=2184016 RepID=A0A317FL71_9PROT|nr:hypothetical protein DFH01_05000 [Falsiroseomonas bella]